MSTFPHKEVNDHPASLGVKSGQHNESSDIVKFLDRGYS